MNTVTFIIIVLSLVIIGILSFICELRTIRETQDEILEFQKSAVAFYNKSNNGQNYDEEWKELFSCYKNVGRLMSKHCYRPAIYDFIVAISNSDKRGIGFHLSSLSEDVVSTIAEYDIEYNSLSSQWWNVFSHFFRGIGTVLRIVFQYPIKLIQPNFDFNSKGWNVFTAIFGILGSAASIVALFLK